MIIRQYLHRVRSDILNKPDDQFAKMLVPIKPSIVHHLLRVSFTFSQDDCNSSLILVAHDSRVLTLPFYETSFGRPSTPDLDTTI